MAQRYFFKDIPYTHNSRSFMFLFLRDHNIQQMRYTDAESYWHHTLDSIITSRPICIMIMWANVILLSSSLPHTHTHNTTLDMTLPKTETTMRHETKMLWGNMALVITGLLHWPVTVHCKTPRRRSQQWVKGGNKRAQCQHWLAQLCLCHMQFSTRGWCSV